MLCIFYFDSIAKERLPQLRDLEVQVVDHVGGVAYLTRMLNYSHFELAEQRQSSFGMGSNSKLNGMNKTPSPFSYPISLAD